MQLFERIKKVRDDIGMSQLKFAEALGVSRGHISKVENGMAAPSDQLIRLICAIFIVNEEWLRTGEGNSTDLNFSEYLQKYPLVELDNLIADTLYDRFVNVMDYLKNEVHTIKDSVSSLRQKEETKKFQLRLNHPKYSKLADSYEDLHKASKLLTEEIENLYKGFSASNKQLKEMIKKQKKIEE